MDESISIKKISVKKLFDVKSVSTQKKKLQITIMKSYVWLLVKTKVVKNVTKVNENIIMTKYEIRQCQLWQIKWLYQTTIDGPDQAKTVNVIINSGVVKRGISEVPDSQKKFLRFAVKFTFEKDLILGKR